MQARLAAEEIIYGGFLSAYHQWKEKADHDPQWGRDNPLIFEVEKTNGILRVKTQ